MAELFDQQTIATWRYRAWVVVKHLSQNWYFLLAAIVVGALIGYYFVKDIKPKYEATYKFVLSTEQQSNGGLAGLASQLGFDGSTSGSQNIFSGDNIIELFKSRKLIGEAILIPLKDASSPNLLTYVAENNFKEQSKSLLPFPKDLDSFNEKQTQIYRSIISMVAGSFMVFKKDNKLVFYTISTTSTDPKLAYYTSTCILEEISSFFIETKTKVSLNSLDLLQHETDSLSMVLSNMYRNTASMNDRTYNINPSISVQRSGALLTQAKAQAVALAYQEVMRQLEIAKINVQRETPLYRIIDEPELPLTAKSESKIRHIIITSMISFFLMFLLLSVERAIKFL